MSAELKTGTCSWTDPTLLGSGWYPERVARRPDERLRYYAERFPIVENDAAYYALPSAKQAQLWADRTPDGFTMSFKAFAPITTHPTDPRRLPKELREALPEEAREKRRLYPKDFPQELLEEVHARYWVALEPLRKAGKLGAILCSTPTGSSSRARARRPSSAPASSCPTTGSRRSSGTRPGCRSATHPRR